MIYNPSTLDSTITFKNASDVPVDMATVTCKVVSPAGTSVTYTLGVDAALTKPTGTGIYNLLVDGNANGIWFFQWHGHDAGGNHVTVQDQVCVIQVN